MKKLLAMSVLALAAVAVSGRPAQAWSNWKFNVGLNLQYQGADNSVLWGLFRGGPVQCCVGGPGANPYGNPYPYFDPTGGLYSKNQPPNLPGAPGTGAGQSPPATAQTPTTPSANPAPPTAPVPTAAASVFQPVGYVGSSSTSFYGPAASQSTAANRAPSYWYGR
jgi:hypothetical protein